MKKLGALLALAFVLASCSSNRPPTYTINQLQGTLPNWTQGASQVTITGRVDTFTHELLYDQPTYTGTLSTNGSFTINLPTPDTSQLTEFTLCTGEKTNGAEIFQLLIANTAPPVYPYQVTATATLRLPGQQQSGVYWMYVDQSITAQGECETISINVNLKPGWNTLVASTTGGKPQVTTGPIPSNAVWIVQSGTDIQSLGIFSQ